MSGPFSRPAQAHPHIWVDVDATMVMENDQITGIAVTWLFDDLFSMTLIDEFDQNHDRRFFDAENDAVRDNAFIALNDVGYLTYLRQNENLVDYGDVRDFKADITDDNRVRYDFVLPLKTPLDPVREAVSLSVYDAEFYIDVAFAEMDPITFTGNTQIQCHYKMGEDEKNRIYFDLVAPLRADFICQ
ncbi:MAG: DUF1007 family protein [Pseudomonadota bacterium]